MTKHWKWSHHPPNAALLALALALVFFLAAARPLAASPGEEFTVEKAGVALRAQPRETANALLTLTPEHLLVEFERRGEWVRVGVFRKVGAFGWVRANELVAVPRPTPQPEPEPPFPEPLVQALIMKIDGTPAVEFRGTCSLLGPPGGERTVILAGHSPKSYRLNGLAVSCRVRKHDFFGRMRLRLYRGENLLARLTTSGPFNQIEIRSAGPWGAAHAIRRGGLVVRDRSLPLEKN